MTMSYNLAMSSTNVAKKPNNLIQVRVPADLKTRTAALFEKLGTNTSDVIRLMLIRADETQSIPFPIRTDAYPISASERIEEIKATFALEDMPLSNEDIKELQDYELALTTTEKLRQKTITELKEKYEA